MPAVRGRRSSIAKAIRFANRRDRGGAGAVVGTIGLLIGLRVGIVSHLT